MAAALTIYSLYRSSVDKEHYLLKTVRDEFPNWSQPLEDIATQNELRRREVMLSRVALDYYENREPKFSLVGELQDAPIGEQLYAFREWVRLPIFYIETDFGWPWIILGSVESEKDFMTELHDDEDLMRLRPVGQPTLVTAVCIADDRAEITK